MNTPKAFFSLVNPFNLKHSEPLFGVRRLAGAFAAQKSFSKRV